MPIVTEHWNRIQVSYIPNLETVIQVPFNYGLLYLRRYHILMETTSRPPSDEAIDLPSHPHVSTWQIGLYFLVLLLISNLGLPGGLSAIPINFFFKDQLKLGLERIALFGFLMGIPIYIGVVLGLLRDRWQPLGGRDRAYMLVLPPLAAAGFLWLSTQPLSYRNIFVVILYCGFCGVLLSAAMQGLMAATAQRYALPGRLSAVFGVAVFLPPIISNYVGGWLTAHVRPQLVFQLCAGLILLVMLFSVWRPHSVRISGLSQKSHTFEDLKVDVGRLIRHRPLYIPAMILFLWNFAPGWGTPLFFYLTEHVKLSSETFGTVLSIQSMFTVLFLLIYGALCKRFTLRTMLWVGLVLGLAGAPLYWFIHSPMQAYVVAALAGVSVGIGAAAFMDLLMRSCPKASEGVTMSLAGCAVAFGWNTSDIVGSWLYARGGFGLALVVSMLTLLPMIPLFLAIPKSLIASRDGEHLPEIVLTSA